MSKRQLIQSDEPQFARDTSTMALINTDRQAFELYVQQRKRSTQVQDLSDEVTSLKSDIEDIKQMLIQLTRKQ